MPQGINFAREKRWLKRAVFGGQNKGTVYPSVHIVPQAAMPTGGAEGSLDYNSTTKSLVKHNGSVWGSVATLYTPVAVTATADGLTTGIVAAGTDFVSVTSANANNIVTLPAPVIGKELRLMVGATGFELRSSDPATIGINGGTGSAAESAIAANVFVTCQCTTATNWVCWQRAAAGTLAVTEVAAP